MNQTGDRLREHDPEIAQSWGFVLRLLEVQRTNRAF